MSDKNHEPSQEVLSTGPIGPNPFANPDLEAHADASRPYHASDHPGEEHPEQDPDADKHPSSGAHGPSAPRRPGTGARRSLHSTEKEFLARVAPGEFLLADGDVTINAGREVTRVHVANVCDRPIQVGSHYHFYEANPGLEFDRSRAWGKRLNVLSGGGVRFEPGVEQDVELIPFSGDRIALGFRGECRGPLDE